MAIYKITSNGVLKTDENKHIPNSTDNKDWKDYLAWVALGNTADEATLDEKRIDAYRSAKIESSKKSMGGVIVNGVTYRSCDTGILEYAYRVEGMRRGKPWPTTKILDMDDEVRTLDLDAIEEIMNSASELHDLIDQNLETLRAAIYASPNPETVDIEAGWPTVPYAAA